MTKQVVALSLFTFFVACSEDEGSTPPTETTSASLTYYADAKEIVDAKCATCHRPGDIGPFSLTNYEEVSAFSGAMKASIAAGTMPPWQPSSQCNSYMEDIDLTVEEKDTLLTWLDQGAEAGDPSDAPEPFVPVDTFEPDITVQLPEPYTPTREPDDYRCQLIPWPATETRFVTGLRVVPQQRSIVHHVIAYLAGPEQVAQFMAYDEAEEGPGYTCYGGPTASSEISSGGANPLEDIDPAALFAALLEIGLTIADLQSGNFTDEQLAQLIERLGGESSLDGIASFRSLGSWVPGIPNRPYAEGTGIRVEPGSMIVAQFHYNTLSSGPLADQSLIEISTVLEVEREATNLAVVDVGWVTNGMVGDAMTIPAGESNVEHATLVPYESTLFQSVRQTLGLSEGDSMMLHSGNHHMHELGKTQRTEIRHADGSTSCVLDIQDWDFQWQGSYTMEKPIRFGPGDSIWMGCTWDNSAANQPIIDGQVKEPADVSWGEGTSDEMCLGGFYATKE